MISERSKPEWMDLKALTQYACVSERTLREWLHRPIDPLPASRVGLAGTGGPQAIIKRLPGGIDAIICLFIRSVGMSKEEQIANAKLILRAPDLLHLLGDVNKALNLRRQRRSSSGVLRLDQSSIQALRTLLRELGEPS